LCILPVCVNGVQSEPVAPFKQFQLQAGDTVRVMATSATARNFGLSVITNTGVHAIFAATPSGGADNALLHIKSGQGLGASLTGQTIIGHYATSVDGSKLESGGGVYYLNDKGLPIGGVSACNPQNLQPSYSRMGGAGIFLNFVARVTTSS